MLRAILHFVTCLLLISVAIYSCSKEEASDTEKPVINISLPHPNESIVLNGDSIHVMINVSDNNKLQSFNAELKTDSGDTWFSESPNVQDNGFYVFHRHYDPGSIPGSISLILTASAMDKSGNSESKTLTFSVSP
jgi:Domain of unknown function (DUF4625)